jgi:hypothetical protein
MHSDVEGSDTGCVKQHQPAFQDAHDFRWDAQPTEERTSAFDPCGGFLALLRDHPTPGSRWGRDATARLTGWQQLFSSGRRGDRLSHRLATYGLAHLQRG